MNMNKNNVMMTNINMIKMMRMSTRRRMIISNRFRLIGNRIKKRMKIIRISSSSSSLIIMLISITFIIITTFKLILIRIITLIIIFITFNTSRYSSFILINITNQSSSIIICQSSSILINIIQVSHTSIILQNKMSCPLQRTISASLPPLSLVATSLCSDCKTNSYT